MSLEHRAHGRALLRGGLHERQTQAADVVAEQVQRGLRAGRIRGHEQRLIDVAAAKRRSPRDARAHRPCGASRCRRCGWPRGFLRRRPCPAYARTCRRRRRTGPGRRSAEFLGVGLLDPLDPVDLGQLGQQVRRHVRRGAPGDVVQQDRLVGGARHRFDSGASGRGGSACCSRASPTASRRRPAPWPVRSGGPPGGCRWCPCRRRSSCPPGARSTASSISAELLVVGQRRGLAGRARHDEPVRAVLGEMAHQRDERLLVDPPGRIERRDDRRQDGAER